MRVHEWTRCSQTDDKYSTSTGIFDDFPQICTRRATELKIDMERARVESTFREYESATAGRNPIGGWASPSVGGRWIREDASHHASHCLSDRGARRAGGFDPCGDVYE